MLPGGSCLDRSLVTERGVQTSFVVRSDPVLDVAARGCTVGPDVDTDLRFDGGEEGFRSRAVKAGADAAGALPDIQAP